MSIIARYPKCIEGALDPAIPGINFSGPSTEVATVDGDGDGISNGEKARAGEDGFITTPLLYDTGGVGLNDGAKLTVGSDLTGEGSISLTEVRCWVGDGYPCIVSTF
ncbi:hypothetical protein ACL7TT_14785 [Microbulbifer sp. 2304DJ12-6]|uniref:hypothetical protein n=1 Tax=Microbulbifer sp. 2304DJ12-6 TaxID=3233340 RepID=UPI0039AFEDF9